jgi:uncharacterized membrane protein (UPF0127 family)
VRRLLGRLRAALALAAFRLRAGLAALAVLAGCSGSPGGGPDAGAADVFRIPVTVQTASGPVTFRAELADTPEERSRGLMFRTAMGADEGMLFLFPDAKQNSFWMRNTLIPLDMVFIRADRTILGVVERATPRTDTPRAVPGESQFVLELNGGVARASGLEAGQEVTFLAPLPAR